MKIRLNSDKIVVENIRAQMERNGGYCPCVPERNEDTKCMCKKMREHGECCCGLYIVEKK